MNNLLRDSIDAYKKDSQQKALPTEQEKSLMLKLFNISKDMERLKTIFNNFLQSIPHEEVQDNSQNRRTSLEQDRGNVAFFATLHPKTSDPSPSINFRSTL